MPWNKNVLERSLTSVLAADPSVCSTRRGLLIAPLLAVLPLAMLDASVQAGQINPAETAITPPDAIEWSGWINGFPPHSGEMATLYGGLDKSGPYLVLMKWYPGYMSAPHTYASDRLSLVLSVVGEQRGRLRSEKYCGSSRRRLRQARCAHPALRRCDAGCKGAGGDRTVWNCAGPV